jgi:endogenous inhibitor of DNA gyrase (YacG/DUF329 family)
MMNDKITNTGRLCSVYCPECKKATDKISFNLLREAGKVSVQCPVCGGITYLEHDGKSVSVRHHDLALEMVADKYRKSKAEK